MPTVAHTEANWDARLMFTTLVEAVVATVMMCRTPAAVARSTTEARCAAKRSSSKCAWVSNSSGITLAGSWGLVGGGKAFEDFEVFAFLFQYRGDQPVGLGLRQVGEVIGQAGDLLP